MKRTTLLLLIFGCLNAIQAQVTVRGPYLQSVAQESIKILWRTNIPAESYVEIALEPGGEPILSFEDTSLLEDHIILVDGLQPSTTYYYTIGNGSGSMITEDERYRFTTSNQTGDQLSFWATGDFGAANQDQIDVRDAFIDHVGGNFPDFWLWLGDNAYDDGTDAEYQERVFTPPYGYDSLLTFLPVYPVPGNHDYGSVNLLSPPPQHRGPYFEIVEVPQNGEAGGVPSGTELYYSFDYGNAHFVAINSEAFAYTLFSNTAMEQWMREDLRNTDKLWKIVFWHQPPYSKGSHDSDDFYEIFMKAMRKNYNPAIEHFGVDMVLCGHSHVYERSHLIRGHFGKSGSFQPHMFIDNEEPYIKYIDGDSANYGTMYIVQGNSGKDEGDPEFGHPVFAFESGGDHVCGSLLVEIDGNRLMGKHIRNDGAVIDEFTIIKALRDSSVITGSIEQQSIRDFKVFPNPTRDRINIQFNLSESTPIEVSIFDMAGKQVYLEGLVEYAAGPHIMSYHLNDLQLDTGQYIIKLGGLLDGQQKVFEQVIKIRE